MLHRHTCRVCACACTYVMSTFKKLQFSKDGIGAVLLKIDSDDVTVVVDKVRRRPCLAANNAVSCSSESKRQRAARQRHNQTARKAQRTRGVGKSGHVSDAKGTRTRTEKARRSGAADGPHARR